MNRRPDPVSILQGKFKVTTPSIVLRCVRNSAVPGAVATGSKDPTECLALTTRIAAAVSRPRGKRTE